MGRYSMPLIPPPPPPPLTLPAGHLNSVHDNSGQKEMNEEERGRWQTVELAQGNLSDIQEFNVSSFQTAIEDLENKWFKKASRLSSFAVSPIHDAAAKGNIDKLSYMILEEKKDVNSKDAVQNTLLHWAAGSGRIEAVIWLLEHGADINAKNHLGDTALHRATWRGYLNVVKLLCAKGIDRTIINRQGHKAVDLAKDIDIGAEIQSYDLYSSDDPVDDEDADY